MYMKDLDTTIESLGFQLTPLEAFVEAELARRNISGEPISKTQEQAYTGAKTSRALKRKWSDQQPSQSRQQPEDEEVFKMADSAEPRIVAVELLSTSATSTPRAPNWGDELWSQDSSVYLSKYPIVPESRFHEGQEVHISERIGSTIMKGSYLISKARYDDSKGYIEYQLLEPLTQLLHNEGAWYRERDLNQGSCYDTGGSNDDFEDAQSMA
ncbi:hypothetical protein HBI38_070840 [Parastagonospora nodorum]|nr:hypothetical protein HBH75_149920 [Parastagonospora nodorum]KAH4938642.1 hypothetical protein HBI79_056630 [Parastagonospora nodorum]KAH5164865.1 hypothetical protein HBI73_038940 [Parastagonospora nodorum]KAH5518390.1 hypothetical protein HBI52_096390 [Parastagonospora nodorum]KAH5594050.1 hypothetical protein HBI45_193700 [Parastagonospora nodorum]